MPSTKTLCVQSDSSLCCSSDNDSMPTLAPQSDASSDGSSTSSNSLTSTAPPCLDSHAWMTTHPKINSVFFLYVCILSFFSIECTPKSSRRTAQNADEDCQKSKGNYQNVTFKPQKFSPAAG